MIDEELPISEGFILAIVASVFGCIAGFLKFVLKSRCRTISCCCNLITCVREPVELTAREIETRSISPQSNRRQLDTP